MERRLAMIGALGCLLGGGQLYAQGWQTSEPAEVIKRLEQCGELYAALPAYELRVDMMSYRSAQDATPFDVGYSIVTKFNEHYRVEHMGTITVQDEQWRVTVDTVDRMIMVGHRGGMTSMIGADHAKIILQHAARVSKRSIDGKIVYEIIFRQGSLYERMEVGFDKDGWLSILDCYWRQAIPEDPDDPRSPSYKPKVTMRFARPVALSSATAAKLTTAEFIAWKGDVPVAARSWSGYEVFDTRVR